MNEIQKCKSKLPKGGSFKVYTPGKVTEPIPFDATEEEVQAAVDKAGIGMKIKLVKNEH
jgi:hypothetical protein